MSDPKRLLSEGGSELERALLRSWKDEAPSAQVQARVLALGAASVAAAVTAGAKAGGAAGAKAAAGAVLSATPKAASAGALLFVKGLAIGALALGAAAVVADRLPYPPSPVATSGAAPTSQSAPPGNAAPAPEPTSAEPEPAPAEAEPTSTEPSPEPQRSAMAAPPSGGRVKDDSPAPAASGTSLSAQVASLDRARQALRAGDPTGALRQIDEHERRYPQGRLSQEATVLRIEARLAQGDRAGAAAIAEPFVASHPTSPLAARVRSLLGWREGP